MKTIALFAVLILGSACFGQQLANAPEPQLATQPITWKQTFDWKFAAVHGAYLGAMLFDQHETLKGEAQGCALESGDNGPYRATRGDLMKKNMPFFAGITVADVALRKLGVKWVWLVAPAVASGKHIYGGTQWINLCR